MDEVAKLNGEGGWFGQMRNGRIHLPLFASQNGTMGSNGIFRHVHGYHLGSHVLREGQ